MSGNGPRRGFRVPPRSVKDIRETALRARSTLNLSNKLDLGRFMESLVKYAVTVDPVDDDFAGLPPNAEACWVPETWTLYLRNSVYEAACRGEPRARFTVFHEMGHLFLAHRHTFNRESKEAFKIFEDAEWQADLFAAEVLMPATEIRNKKLSTPSQVMDEFGVSRPAAEYRLAWLAKRGEL